MSVIGAHILTDTSQMRFEASIEKHGRGHLVEIPFDVKAMWGRARAPVVATINGHTFRSTVAVYGGRYLLGLNREVRDAAGVQAGGPRRHRPRARYRRANGRAAPELRAPFADDPELRAFFDSLSYTHRKEYVRWIEEAKREETRRERADKAVAMLRDGIKTLD
jgi:Bacteriocin-protection, YdeI or OmpD-Associated/Domain of unknown function (DUF1905)